MRTKGTPFKKWIFQYPSEDEITAMRVYLLIGIFLGLIIGALLTVIALN